MTQLLEKVAELAKNRVAEFTPQTWQTLSGILRVLQPKESKNGSANCNHFDGSLVYRSHFHRVLHAETVTIWCSAFRAHVFSSRPEVRIFVPLVILGAYITVFGICLWHRANLSCVRGIVLHHNFPVAISILWSLHFFCLTVVVAIAEMTIMLMYF